MKLIVTFSDNSETTIEVRDDSPLAVWGATIRAEQATGKRYFATRPEGCTGLSTRAHFGRYCPIHADA